MKTSSAYPPNYKEITTAFNIKGRRGIIFTYGDTIYNPSKIDITPDLLAHEEVHQRQQGKDPASWWVQYLNDPQFRYEQELAAYRAQYQYAQNFYGRQQRRVILSHVIKALSGPMYGNLVTPAQAKDAITKNQPPEYTKPC